MASQFKTFVAGDVLTAAEVNGYLMKQTVIVCDSDADYPGSPVEGMVVYDKALNRGLYYDGAAWIPTFGAVPSVSAAAATNESVSTATWTSIDMDAENWDTDGFHDNATNNSRLTVPAGLAGRYHVTGTIEVSANGTGDRMCRIAVNGSHSTGDGHGAAVDMSAEASLSTRLNVACIIELAAGDYVEIQAYQSSGGALNIKGYLQMAWLSA